MTATPDRTTVIIYSTIQSTPSSTQSNATSSSSSGSGKKGNFTGIAVGGAIGGFAMTVLLTAGLWWMWKRRNPWWNATPQDVPDGSAIASSTAKFDEEKANRSLPSRPSTSSANHSSTPKTYEYGVYGMPNHEIPLNSPPLAKTTSKTGSIGSHDSHSRLSHHIRSQSPSHSLYMKNTEKSSPYDMPSTSSPSPPSAWHVPPNLSLAFNNSAPFLPSQPLQATTPRSLSASSVPSSPLMRTRPHHSPQNSQAENNFPSNSSQDSHSSHRLIMISKYPLQPPKVVFQEPPPPSPTSEKGLTVLSVTNPDTKDSTYS